ncbi:hypothetical protein [Phenylobacterium sp.]|uniref:hypothetical protein n=1 Tax=Phenylobacterium sp. TaxID=1871053 RepID=UPI0027312E65|nr:hypothetical protein [Phenylobacterium sp.]MDP1619359.1 hypothetical protein [Phenylobacterium sp.]MDP1987482.1 hypothetical protein [Phenylobacterium sp.]
MLIADYANEQPPGSRLGPLSDMMVEEDLAAPIDMYRAAIFRILNYGTAARLRGDPFLGRLLVLGVVSAAEAYFRAILSSCIEMCPLAQSGAAHKAINLGGLLWHGKEGFSRSAFEHASFTSRKELNAAFLDFLSMPLDDKVFKSLLEEYEIVCQLRHGIVHGDGLLPGKNAVQLDIPRYGRPVRITVNYAHLQDIASVVTTLVATVNRETFSKMCERWAIQWRKRADWDVSKETARFNAIWAVFHSTEELKTRRGRSQVTRARCLAAVKLANGL